MSRTPQKIFSASWTSDGAGIVSLTRDWTRSTLPPLFWGNTKKTLHGLKRASLLDYGKASGYFVQGSTVIFCVQPSRYPNLDLSAHGVYVVGKFNEWDPCLKQKTWKLAPAVIDGCELFVLKVRKDDCFGRNKKVPFKFLTGKGEWLEVLPRTPNVLPDAHGNLNLYLCSYRTGLHQFTFTPPVTFEKGSGAGSVLWNDGEVAESAIMMPGEYLHNADSKFVQGAVFWNGNTLFRIFAPRATSVKVEVFRKLDRSDAVMYEAERVDVGTWEAVVLENCEGAYYFFHIDGEPDSFSHFDPSMSILDPWALACAGPNGPGIALNRARIQRPGSRFVPPRWQDLIIAEAHVRDLTARAPVELTKSERLGFSGLAKWVRHPDFYLHKLGVNAVELQPVQQNDEPTKEGYHWGYMTNNYFAPNCHYALNPEDGSQIDEMQDLVGAFHERGMAVILDVVYNHVGEPNFLQYVDKHYYFDLTAEGRFMNWSGCGNTLNCATPMAYKLMVESLKWLIEAYDVDGFRFDLAELVGIEQLKKLESELKQVKPSIILIAEPWSFRGHIGLALKDTGFASWNDGFREYVRNYLLGKEKANGIKYFLAGSLEHLSAWPAQSVNYVESHDDMCWMDRITQNDGSNATNPTLPDRRRTHMMCALLMMSLGIPMLSAGQDFMRTKKGHNNTYKMGDVNVIDYERLRRFSGTHEYFRSWIAFRKSATGALLRLWEKPQPSYFRFVEASGGSRAVGMLINADLSNGSEQLFFAVNPDAKTGSLQLGDLDWSRFVQIADTEVFDANGLTGAEVLSARNGELDIPPESCALWKRRA